MTELSKTVRRKTSDTVRDGGKLRHIVVECHPQYLSVRPLGCQRSYDVSYHDLYVWAVQRKLSRDKAEKKATKKAVK
jgi:hypothetical protein